MDDNERLINWIDSNLEELSNLKNNKGKEILINCGEKCSKNSDLLILPLLKVSTYFPIFDQAVLLHALYLIRS